MPVIVIANSKGGSGKSTAALLLACELAEGADVILIDADPRRPIAAWARDAGKSVPQRLTVVESGGQDAILDEIEEAAASAAFVLVDLEGVASRLTSYAVGQADLVLIPAQEQHQDAMSALSTYKETQRDAKAVRRAIPAALVLSRTRVVAKSRTARHVAGQLRANGKVPVIKTELAERDAYAAIFSAGLPLRKLGLSEVNNLPAAINNAEHFAAEIVELLRSHEKHQGKDTEHDATRHKL